MNKTALLAFSSILALSACGDHMIGTSWHQEAGAYINEGGFGQPTRTNMLVQTGQLNYVVNLNTRFSNEVDPMVNFEFNQSYLDAQAQATLVRQATWINQFPEVKFRVYGYADAVGSNSYNYKLGMRRAQTVVSFLVSQGISRSRLQAVVSYGETRPLIDTQAPERRNRRTVTEVAGFVGRHPTVLNGKYASIIFREYVDSAKAQSPLQSNSSTSGAASGG